MLSTPRAEAVSIKLVGPFDLGRLSRLHKACFEEAWSRSDLAHLLALPGGFGLIARASSAGLGAFESMRGAGFTLCRVVREESELLSIGVVPGYRRKGLASSLLRASMERCLRWGAQIMFLEVAVDNVSAQRLYQAHGFERVGVRNDYYVRRDGSRAHAYSMRVDISESLECGSRPLLASGSGATSQHC